MLIGYVPCSSFSSVLVFALSFCQSIRRCPKLGVEVGETQCVAPQLDAETPARDAAAIKTDVKEIRRTRCDFIGDTACGDRGAACCPRIRECVQSGANRGACSVSRPHRVRP